MAISRSQMGQQITKPPMKRKKNAKGRVLQKGKSKVQGVPKRIRKRRNRKVPKSRR